MTLRKPKFLQKRRRRWYAVLEIPVSVRMKFEGQRRFVQSLETESLSEAERLVLPLVGRWKAEIEAAKSGSKKPIKDLTALALEFRHGRENDDAETRELRDDLISDKALDLQWSDPEGAETFHKIAHGNSIPTKAHVDDWLSISTNAPKTKDMKRSDVLRLAAVFEFTHKIDVKAVQRWAHDLEQGGLAPATVTRIISACRGYWDYLNRAGHLSEDIDPFVNAVRRTSGKTKADQEKKRQPFSQNDLAKLLNAATHNDDPMLRDFIWLAMWTGCRIEELGSLPLKLVDHDSFTVDDAKSGAGNRVIPIHSCLKPVVERLRLTSEDDYLLSGLTFNKYDDRSNAVGKRFGHLKTKLGFDRRYVFHSIRKTVATELENAGVPENVAADILGHEKKTMTYGTYSGGSTFRIKKEALELLQYPDC